MEKPNMSRLSNKAIADIAQSVYGKEETQFGNITAGDIKFRTENDTYLSSIGAGELDAIRDNAYAKAKAIEANISEMFKEEGYSNVVKTSNATFSVSRKAEDDSTLIVTGGVSGSVSPAIKSVIDEVRRDESFDGIASRSSRASALICNLVFERKTRFEQVIFPCLLLEGDKTSYDIRINVPVLIDNMTKDASKIAHDFRKDFKAIPMHFWTEELIKSNSTKLLHIISSTKDTRIIDARKAHLNENLKRPSMYKGQPVEVAPIKIMNGEDFNEFDVINAGSLSYAESDVKNNTDTLQNIVYMKSVFVKIRAISNTKQNLEITYKLDCKGKTGNIFDTAIENGDNVLRIANGMKFTIPDIKAVKKYSTATDDNTEADTEFSNAVASLAGSIDLEIVPNIIISRSAGFLKVNGFSVKVNASDDIKKIVKFEATDFEIDATLSNTNFSEAGQLIGNVELDFTFAIDWKDPVSLLGPIKDRGDGAATNGNIDFNRSITLGTMVNSQSAVHAVKEFLEYFKAVSAKYGSENSTVDYVNKLSLYDPKERSISMPYIIPYVKSYTHNVADTNSLTSSELMGDVRSNIMNRIGQVADEMLQHSRYINAFQFLNDDASKKPCLAIVTSSNVAKYLRGTDNTEDFSPKPLNSNLDYIVVSIPSDGKMYNQDFYEKAYLTFVDPKSIASGVITEVEPITFGFTLYKNFLTYDFVKTARESVKYLSALPIYKHIAQLPLMVSMQLNGISKVTAEKTSILFENSLFKKGGAVIK